MRHWLKKLRTEKNLTMKDLAERLGISESYYCSIENGERQKRMDIAFVGKLAEVLNISVYAIVDLEAGYLSEATTSAS